MKNVAILGPISNEDVWNIPISFYNHFVKLGFNTTFYNTLIDNKFKDDNLSKLISDYEQNIFVPDLILHLDFGFFNSPFLQKSYIPTAKWVVESGDDPQNFKLNSSKILKGNFDLIMTPDIRCVPLYQQHNLNAVWCPYFADPDQFDIEQEPIYDAVTTRSVEEPFFALLKNKLGNRFMPRSGDFFHGKAHSSHLKKGKIVIQNSKYKEISRRIFEGMMARRLVITDRPDPNTKIDLIFTEGKHIVYFDNVDDCIDKINYYSVHHEERETIALNGYTKVTRHHTTSVRIKKILEQLL